MNDIVRATRRNIGLTFREYIQEYSIFLILIVIIILSSIFIPAFRTTNNMINVIRQVSALAIAGLGQFFVIITGGLDLSQGSTIGLTSVLVAGFVYSSHFSIVASIVLALGICLVVGFINGVLIVYTKVNAFIATLSTMTIIKGVNFLYSKGSPISGLPISFSFIGRGYLWYIPFPVILMIILAIIFWIFSTQTATGRVIFAVGGNEEASKLSGINVNRVKVLVYVISSFLAGISAIVITSRTMAGQANVGESMLFDILTAVILGGTSLSGGKGRMLGVVAAALILGMLSNVMVLLKINTYWQWIIKGVVLIIAVIIDAKNQRN
jgi:ribose transport system permease protein